MTHWNYRVRASSVPTGADDYEEVYTIVEVYYDGDGMEFGGANGMSWGTATAMGNSGEELRDDLQRMLQAFDKPILTEEDLPDAR